MVASAVAAVALTVVAVIPVDDQTDAPGATAASPEHRTASRSQAGSTSGAAAAAQAPLIALDARSLPIDATRAEHVAAATLVLVEGRAGLARSVDAARADLKRLGGHTVSFNETEGRPTSADPCPVPIDAYSSGGLRPVAFPCPISGQQADSAQLVMAVPVPRVQSLLRRMDGYGEILGRATQIVDAQQTLDASRARTKRLERQIVRLRELIAATRGDTSALRAQLAQKVGQLAALEDRRATTTDEVRFAQVALNLTTVRPPDKPAERNWFVGAVGRGWDVLARLVERVVTLLVILVPATLVMGLIALPLVRHRRRRAAAGDAT